VDRFADHPELELRPVFLVALPEDRSAAGYLVFGSSPEPSLAAQYGVSLGTTHALVGVLRAEGDDRALDATLADVAAKRGTATLAHPIPAGALADTFRIALSGTGDVAGPMVVLVAWGLAAVGLSARYFRWE